MRSAHAAIGILEFSVISCQCLQVGLGGQTGAGSIYTLQVICIVLYNNRIAQVGRDL